MENRTDPGGQRPLVSVMMPAYNAARYIEAAVRSVLAQTYTNWELVIVDDGSSDGTSGRVALTPDPRIRLFQQANQGEAASRNVALGHMTGEYTAFLDADDQFRPDHLATCVSYLEANPRRGGVYTDGHYVDAAGREMERLSSHRRGPFEGDLFEQVVRASDCFGPPICLMLRSSIIARHALTFDRRIVIGPDWDFTVRFAEVADFGYLDQSSVLYRVHQTNITLTAGSERRRRSLAQCRENAARRPRFGECSTATRAYVFYDLLVNLLTGIPDEQEAVTRWPEFLALPGAERARLFRLMAGDALLRGQTDRARAWYASARSLAPFDPRHALLAGACAISPGLARALLRGRRSTVRGGQADSPFGALN